MAGILYLAVACLTGAWLTDLLVAEKKEKISPWLYLASSFGLGTLALTWLVYLLAWIFAEPGGSSNPLLWANLTGIIVCLLAVCLLWLRKKSFLFRCRKPTRGESVFFLILLLFITWIMFYVFQEKDGNMYAGFTVFSDYAPHTAMIRSFSRMNNFPTQYPHFGGEDVRYHFMFQFLAGNLEYLGLRIDIAYNLISILSLESFLIVLTELARRLGAGMAGSILTVLFFFFRSGTAFFRFAWEHLQQGDLWQTLAENTQFIGYTANENWGLWNFNVYLNQRHLAFGLLIGGLAILYFTDRLPKPVKENGSVFSLRRFFFSAQAWKPMDPAAALLLGTAIGLTGFWNGAAVIGCLLILAGYALFSRGRLDYVILAGCAVFFSALQTRIFTWGGVISPSFVFGFLADEKTLPGVLLYLLQITGVTIFGLVAAWLFLSRTERAAFISFVLPTIFALTCSMTPDITVNHKYIMITMAFLAVLWGRLTESLLKGRWFCRILAVLLIIVLTATGFYDFVVIVKDNDAGHRYVVEENAGITAWLDENLTDDDLVLTGMYSLNEVTISGCMLYNGWPYYAWSAGYDTDYRSSVQLEMYTTDDPGKLREMALEEGITYIIYEEGLWIEETICREDTLKAAFPLVYDDGLFRVYKVE